MVNNHRPSSRRPVLARPMVTLGALLLPRQARRVQMRISPTSLAIGQATKRSCEVGMMTRAIGEDLIHRIRPRATLRLQRYCTRSIPTERSLTSAAEKGFCALGCPNIQTTRASSLLLWRFGKPWNVTVWRGLFTQVPEKFDARGERFATIVFNEMLYYTADPVGLLRKYSALLWQGGVVLCSIYEKPWTGKETSLRRKLWHFFDRRCPVSNLHCAAMVRTFLAREAWPILEDRTVPTPGGLSAWHIWLAIPPDSHEITDRTSWKRKLALAP